MRKTSLFIGTASYVILAVPSLVFSGKSGDYGLMLVSLMICALVVSTVLSGVAFSLGRESYQDLRRPRSALRAIELVVLGLPAFATAALGTIAILSILAMLVTRLAS